MQIERVDTVRCRGGENPMWDHERQLLYFIDNSGRMAHRYDPNSGETSTWTFPAVITTLVLRPSGGAVVTLRSGIHFFDFETEKLDLLAPLGDPPPYVYNDGKVDRRGRFVIGASTPHFHNPTPDGGLFSFDASKSLVQLDKGIHFSNGPCFSPDDRTLYFADSWLNTIYAYDYDLDTGSVSNRRDFVNTSELGGLPDGATIDAAGNLWVAIYGGGKLACYSPAGELRQVIDMPVIYPSSVAFGGPDLDRLYVTTIQVDEVEPADDPQAGELFVVTGLDARGIAEPYFAE